MTVGLLRIPRVIRDRQATVAAQLRAEANRRALIAVLHDMRRAGLRPSLTFYRMAADGTTSVEDLRFMLQRVAWAEASAATQRAQAIHKEMANG